MQTLVRQTKNRPLPNPSHSPLVGETNKEDFFILEGLQSLKLYQFLEVIRDLVEG